MEKVYTQNAHDDAQIQHDSSAQIESELNKQFNVAIADDVDPVPFQWFAPSAETILTIRMSDEGTARAVFEKFPQLHFEDPYAAQIWDARFKASQGQHGETIEERAKVILMSQALDSDVASESLYILNTIVANTDKTNLHRWRSEALHEAGRIYRLQYPVFPCTDAGNGERFAYHHFRLCRYVDQFKDWLVWDGKCWKRDRTGGVARDAKETARMITSEAKTVFGEEYTKIMKHALASESNHRLKAMLERAATEDGMTISADELDANVWLFNCANGTFDLRNEKFRQHDPEDLLTKMSPVSFDEKAQCPLFMNFIRQIFDGDEEMVRYLARVVGYALVGDTREQIFLVLHGGGSNGKSVLLNILFKLFGDYAHTMEPSTISAKWNDKMATDVAELQGKRFVVSSESNEGRRLDEGLIKRMTGGDQLTGERKFEAPFTFYPQFCLFYCTNHKPEIRGTDNGIWRRVQLVPFNVTFWSEDKAENGPPDLKADTSLYEKLESELSGIFNWVFEGFRDWKNNGLRTPEKVRVANSTYREEQDILREFLDLRCVLNDEATVTPANLYQAYLSYCESSSEKAVTKTAFGKKIKARGFLRVEGDRTRAYRGIGLADL